MYACLIRIKVDSGRLRFDDDFDEDIPLSFIHQCRKEMATDRETDRATTPKRLHCL